MGAFLNHQVSQSRHSVSIPHGTLAELPGVPVQWT